MATLRMFGPARQAAGVTTEMVSGSSVGEVLDAAASRFGSAFGRVMMRSRIWVNGEVAERTTRIADSDEVAILPPVSGG